MSEHNKPVLGLKKLRRVRGSVPTYKCDNCRCMRYSKCGCQRKAAKAEGKDKA